MNVVYGHRFRAVTISVAIHIIALAALGIAKFSYKTTAESRYSAAAAYVSMAQTAPVSAKPKVKFANTDDRHGYFDSRRKKPVAVKPAGDIFEHSEKPFRNRRQLLSPFTSSESGQLHPGQAAQVNFFASSSTGRKVCFLVDCSGSMHGVFKTVKSNLTSCIKNLQPDQFFYIIFFGNGQLIEFGDGRLLRARAETKTAACDFIDSVRPAGQTNAFDALKRSLQLRDASGMPPSLIYLLTDGFELANANTDDFSLQIERLLRQLKSSAKPVKIHTIGFWPQNRDKKLLLKIAGATGGKCHLVEGK